MNPKMQSCLLCSDLQNLRMSYKGGQEGTLSVPALHVVHPRPWGTWLRCVYHAAWCSGQFCRWLGRWMFISSFAN